MKRKAELFQFVDFDDHCIITTLSKMTKLQEITVIAR